MTLQVELVSPERILYSGEAQSVIARTLGGGDIAFLTGHSPFVGALDIGPVTIRTSGEAPDEVIAVHGGFVEVSPQPTPPGEEGAAPRTQVTILSDVAELSGQIDAERARRAKERAEAAVREDATDAEAVAAVRRANVRLAVAEGTVGAGAH